LFWYGIHGVETLFTIMGTGCETVRRTQTKDTEFVVGVWKDGRIGTFRGTRNGTHGYGAIVFGEKKTSDAGTYEGYKPLAIEIAKFFKTGKPPIDPQETIEIFAFMEAADVSKSNGNAVSLESVIESAKNENAIPAKIQVAADGKLTLNGKPIEKDNLKSALNVLVKQPNDRVKVTLISEKETPIETVQEICNHLGNAMLVNYVYDYR
jgi:biopolymer transport protein ExbD